MKTVDFQDIKESYFYITGISILIAASLFFFFRLTLPKVKLCYSLRLEISKKEEEIKSKKETINQKVVLKNAIDEVKREYANFEEMVFPETEASLAVREITSIAKALKIDFVSIVPSAYKKIEPPKKDNQESVLFLWQMPISLKMKANYNNLIEFINRIEEEDKFIKIEKFLIKKNAISPLIHDVDMDISVFSLPESDGITKKNPI